MKDILLRTFKLAAGRKQLLHFLNFCFNSEHVDSLKRIV